MYRGRENNRLSSKGRHRAVVNGSSAGQASTSGESGPDRYSKQEKGKPYRQEHVSGRGTLLLRMENNQREADKEVPVHIVGGDGRSGTVGEPVEGNTGQDWIGTKEVRGFRVRVTRHCREELDFCINWYKKKFKVKGFTQKRVVDIIFDSVLSSPAITDIVREYHPLLERLKVIRNHNVSVSKDGALRAVKLKRMYAEKYGRIIPLWYIVEHSILYAAQLLRAVDASQELRSLTHFSGGR